ncbi:hypothetical protein WCY_03336 [Escherichia coli KTE16]|nr:hypothetical protein WCY_03336 [Escherichia coli KTE16]
MDTPLFHLFLFFSFFIKKLPEVIKFFLCFKNTFDIHFIRKRPEKYVAEGLFYN